MRYIHVLILAGILAFTLNVYGQSVQSQETIDALQDQKIAQTELSVRANGDAIHALMIESTALRSSLDRFTGIGIGIGSALTALQAVLVIITFRNKK